VPALSVNVDGTPFFNMAPSSEELKAQLPLLQGRILGFTKFKVSYYSSITGIVSRIQRVLCLAMSVPDP
jgi:hypothetical protein